MIGAAKEGVPVSITGLGSKAPERVVTNDELAKMFERVKAGG